MEPNPYGLSNLWTTGDAVTKFVAILLLIMSIASWYVMIVKSIQLLRYRRAGNAATREFWDTTNVADGVKTLGTDNPYADTARAGISAVEHHNAHKGHLHDELSISDWVTLSLRQAIDESAGKLQSGMAVLASVGSTAPFVGLFGTVWGIYHALVAIGVSGNTGIDKVAGPVGEALIMTALGLAVAIPATFGYNALVRANKSTLAKLHKFGFDLHALFVTGSRSSDSNDKKAKLQVIGGA